MANYRAGLIASAVYNVAAAQHKNPKFKQPMDFFEGKPKPRHAVSPPGTVDVALNTELLQQFEDFQQDFYAAKKQGRIR
jgi:hypothetical protein